MEYICIITKKAKAFYSFSLTFDSYCSIPFSAEDIDMAIPAIDPDEIDLPAFEYSCAQFLNPIQT